MKRFITVMLSVAIALCSMPVFADNIEEVFEDCGECEILEGYDEIDVETENEQIEKTVIEEIEDDVVAYADMEDFVEISNSEEEFVLDIEEIEGLDMAASCKHTWNTSYSNLGEKHQITKTCSKCGKSNTSKASHKTNKNQTYSQKDDKYHNVVSVCTDCNGTFTKQSKHSFSSGKCKYCGYVSAEKCKHSSIVTTYQSNGPSKHYIIRTCKNCGAVRSKQEGNHSGGKIVSATAVDSSKHNIVQNCTKCKQNYTITKNHSYSSGKCKVCGYKPSYEDINVKEATKYLSKATPKATPRPSTTSASRDGQGCCGLTKYSADKSGSKQIYANCPKCGAKGSDSTFIKNVKISTKAPVTYYHQNVKCNNCKKQYYNLCFTETKNYMVNSTKKK